MIVDESRAWFLIGIGNHRYTIRTIALPYTEAKGKQKDYNRVWAKPKKHY